MRRNGIAAIRSLAAALSAGRGAAEVNLAILGEASAAVGAERAVLVVQDDAGVFAIVAATHEADRDRIIGVLQLASPLWSALLGRSRLTWSSEEGAARPLPFAGDPGWSQVVAVGLPFATRRQGLLVVGRDAGGPFAEADLASLDLFAMLAAVSMDKDQMEGDFRTLVTLLSAAVDVAARTVDAQSPEEIRQILLEGLVKDMGMDAAVLWEPTPRGAGMALTRSVGLPVEVQQQVAQLSADSTVSRLHEDRLNVRLLHGNRSLVSTAWPGTRIRLLRVGQPASGVLGVYSTTALPDFVDGVLATLSQALARAVQQSAQHQRTQQVADSLVQELRPRSVAAVEGLEVGYIYRSATKGVPIGGDFFDWFVTENGLFGVACGDVSGKGVEAASLTAMAVYSLRAFALPGDGPGAVLAKLNAAISNQTQPERFATMVYALMDPRTGHLQWSLAGHPVPALIRDGEPRLLDIAADMPIGVVAKERFVEHATTLEPGDSLVLVTDGVTEARRLSEDSGASSRPAAIPDVPQGQDVASADDEPLTELLGELGLLDALRGHAGSSAQEIADAVWHRVMGWTGGGTTDDVAIVVLRRR